MGSVSFEAFGKMSVRGSAQDLTSQVKFYMDMEAKAQVRWRKQMLELEALGSPPAHKLREVTVSQAAATGTRKAGPAVKSTEAKGMDDKWQDYWKNRL